jgi:PPOX class probable F420-dependent enzyme
MSPGTNPPGDADHERLRTEPNIWMATSRPDGRPHLTPVWFVWALDRFWVGTAPGAVKVRNLTANPAVALALESGNRPIVAEGTATIHAGPATVPIAVVEAFRRKYDWALADEAGGLTVVEVAVTRWLHPGGA